MTERRTLYPALQANRTWRLPVTPPHELYLAEYGNPDGKPVILLHGGPGAGANPGMARFHDPRHHRLILFDQRGAGRSTPRTELSGNTTWELVADLERIRVDLDIETWQVFGGSWGACLALAYAQTHPERVSELILRGVFTGRRREVDWFYQSGASVILPEAWSRFLAPIPEPEHGDLVAAYYARLTGGDDDERLACARAWSMWEGAALSLVEDPARVAAFGRPDYALTFATIECHYFVNNCFFAEDGELIANAGSLAGIPGTIVQGRYDVCTPPVTAWELAQAWPGSEFRMISDSGHAMTEPGIVDALVSATDTYRDR